MHTYACMRPEMQINTPMHIDKHFTLFAYMQRSTHDQSTCMYSWLNKCMRAQMRINTWMRACARIQKYKHASIFFRPRCTQTYKNADANAHVNTHARIDTQTYTKNHMHTYAHIHTYHAHTRVCIYFCASTLFR